MSDSGGSFKLMDDLMAGSAKLLRRATLAGATAIAVFALSGQAMAADAFGSFTGTNGAGGFTYGSTDGTTFTPFTNNMNCVIGGTTCLQRSAPSSTGDLLPGAYHNSGAAFSFGTVNVPATSLVLHPGPANNGTTSNLESVYLAYTAPTAGVYNFSAAFKAVDSTPTGVGISSFTLSGSTGTETPLASLANSFGSSFSTSGSVTLAAGEAFGFIIDKGLFYYNDSTSTAFSISAAPEPATWGMMIVGFGFAGFALRRRSARRFATV